MFKIFINDGKSEMPQDDIFYIIAKNGIFLKKKVGILESVAPVNEISILERITSEAKLNIGKVPLEKFAPVLEFFKKVYELHRSEAVVLLFYNQKRKRYVTQVPPQEVSYAGIEYIKNKVYKGYDLIGTIHSHGNMSAFHSTIDHVDEEHFDGLHITIGDVKDDFFTISCSVMSNGQRFVVNPSEYIEGPELVEYTPYWSSMFKPKFEVVDGKKFYKNKVKTKLGYTLLANEDEKKFDKKWLHFVKKRQYTSYYSAGSSAGSFDGVVPGQVFGTLTSKFQNKSIVPYISEEKFTSENLNPCDECIFKSFIKSDLTRAEINQLEIDQVGDLEELEAAGYLLE